jgi:predicted XRE-type DNA-binding protein
MPVRKVTLRNSREMMDALGLSPADHAALRVQFELVEEIRRGLKRGGLTHAGLARLAETSRPRVTAILNGNLEGVSTDLLLRLLGALGVRVELRFRRAA